MNNTQLRALAMIESYEAETKKDNSRIQKAISLFNNDLARTTNDCGLAGKVAELLSHDSYSTITRVQKQGANDLYIIIDGKRIKCEYKTNGGRIESLYKIKNPYTSYVVYELDFTPPVRTKKDGSIVISERRYVKKLLTVASLLNIIESTKAVKITKHKNLNDCERAIQCSSKKLYEALLNGGFVDYDRNKTYLARNIK